MTDWDIIKQQGLRWKYGMELVWNGSNIGTRHVAYTIVTRDGKQYAEPVGKEHSVIKAGDKTIILSERHPLELTACNSCGVYGLVHAMHVGEYACVNCGVLCILTPSTSLKVGVIDRLKSIIKAKVDKNEHKSKI